HPDERADTLERFAVVVSGKADVCHHATRLLTTRGDGCWVELRARAIRDAGGRIVANTGTIIDISDRHAAEEMLADQTRILGVMARGAALEQTLGELAALVARGSGGRAELVLGDNPPEADRARAMPALGARWPARVHVPIQSAASRGQLATLVLRHGAG